jgi:hypothetical protein
LTHHRHRGWQVHEVEPLLQDVPTPSSLFLRYSVSKNKNPFSFRLGYVRNLSPRNRGNFKMTGGDARSLTLSYSK